MGKNTEIQWTTHSHNFWYGCRKVSAGCKFCYAEREMTRYGRDFNTVTKAKGFNKPLSWKEPARVFVNSWSDFFIEEADPWREEAWEIIHKTPHLTYQILTKRPENIPERLPEDWGKGWSNVWLGVSVEDQDVALLRILDILKIPARIRFLSCEPLLGEIDLTQYLYDPDYCCWNCGFIPIDGDNVHEHILDQCPICEASWDGNRRIHWVIAGGESGPKARPMHPKWVKQIRDQCQEAGVPFFFKQWGRYRPLLMQEYPPPGPTVTIHYPGDKMDNIMVEVGKKAAGAVLDGLEWREFPK